MKRILLAIALVSVAGTVGAQTVSTAPAKSDAGSAAGAVSAGGSGTASLANAPSPRIPGAAATAQKRIEQDGYSNVQNLKKGDDGLWRGTAMRGNSQVEVVVDRAGRVAIQ